MSAYGHKGTRQIIKDAVAKACGLEGVAKNSRMSASMASQTLCLIVRSLNADMQKTDDSFFFDIDVVPPKGDEEPFPVGLILANRGGSLYAPLIWTDRALRIDRSGTQKFDIVVPLAAPDAAPRMVEAFGQIIDHFDSWSAHPQVRGYKH